jgi:hypothetical protein
MRENGRLRVGGVGLGFWRALAALVLLGVGGSAMANPGFDRAYRYELRAMGTYAGEAVFSIGKPEEVGSRTLVPIQIDGFTAGITKNFVDAKTQSTTWVDKTWVPMRARSDQTIDRVKRVIKTSFERKKIAATDERDGKLFKKYDFNVADRGFDLVSIFAWLMHQDLSPSARYTVPVFDGRRIYQLDITVGIARELQVPIGIRRAIPLKIKVSRGDYKRDVELWIGADKERTPLKLVFKYGVIGTVEASLVSERKG